MVKTAIEETRLSNIDVIRCFAILSLVAWHSLCVYVGWRGYLPDITAAVEGSVLVKWYCIFTTKIIMPDANMPLFVIIAAYVYSCLWKKGKYRDSLVFFQKKAKRLVVPYFVIGTIVIYTIADWHPISILWGDAHHLWFCAMLFWCFVFIRVCQKLPPPFGALLVICGLFLQIHPVSVDVLGFLKGLKYFPYFVFGYYLYIYLPKIKEYRWHRLMVISIWLLAVMLYFSVKRSEFICYAYCFMIFDLIPENPTVPTWIKKISMYSFGIYVFHEWFLWNVAHIEQIHPFIIEHQILYPLIMFVSVLCISILLTKYSLKTKLGRFLLGG